MSFLRGGAWANDLTPPQLSSKAGAAYTLYLNFSGFTWNEDWDNSTDVAIPGVIPAYSVDGDTTSFNGQEMSYIQQIWSRVAEKYAMFNVNVTTADPAAHLATDAERQAYYNAQPRFMHTSIGGSNSWYANAGGVSYVGVTPWTYGATAPYHLNFAWPHAVGGNNDLRAIAEVIAHENGHGIGAGHQSDYNGGTFVHEYSVGTGTAVGSYAPVMGDSYNSERGLWSVGTDGDGDIQNDVQVFLSKSNFTVIPATAGQTWQTATAMTGVGGAIDFNLAKGVISTKAGLSNPDAKAASSYTTDFWSFTTSGGNVTITANSGQSMITPGSADPGATLDAFIQILDGDGDVVASSAGYAPAAGHLNGTITTNLTAGDYFVRVSNTLGASGTGLVDTSYNERSFFDMGSYFLTGTIPGLAHEVVQYWDNDNGNGFGNAGGTWAATTNNLWNTSSDGSGTRGSNISIATIDSVNFGSSTDGLGAGTVSVSGTVSANRITFGSAAGAIALSGGTITMASMSPTIAVNNASATIASALAGNAGLRKEGTGTLVLSGNNTYMGATVVAAGTLALAGNASLTEVRMNTINMSASGATLDISGISAAGMSVGSITGVSGSGIALGSKNLTTNPATSTTYSGVISGSGGSLTKAGIFTLTLNGANTYTGGTNIQGGTLQFNSVGLASTTGSITFTGNGSLRWSGHTQDLSPRIVMTDGVTATIDTNNQAVTFASGIGNSSTASLTKAGGNVLTLNGVSTYSGATTVSGGTLAVSVMANGGVVSSVGASSNASTNLVLNNGTTLRYVGSSPATTNRAFRINGTSNGHGATIESSGTGTFSFNTPGTALTYGSNNQSRTLTLGGTNTGANTFGKVIANNGAGVTSLVKNGSGRWILDQANTYTGTTTISGGTLVVDATGSLASSLISVQAGGALGGAGTISGNVSFANESFFDVSSAVVSDPLGRDWLSVGGTITFGSSFGVGSLLGIDWNSIGLGTYTLIATTQTNWGSLANFGEENAYFDIGSGKSAYFATGSLNLVVVPEPSAYALLGGLTAFGFAAIQQRRRRRYPAWRGTASATSSWASVERGTSES